MAGIGIWTELQATLLHYSSSTRYQVNNISLRRMSRTAMGTTTETSAIQTFTARTNIGERKTKLWEYTLFPVYTNDVNAVVSQKTLEVLVSGALDWCSSMN